VYSTWCAFWQEPDTEPVLAEARLARDLGCGTLILDDGWQTMQANQAYAFCGEWKNERMGDMSAFVGAVHDLGMKCLLWYPIALVGYESKVWERFAPTVIRDEPGWRSAYARPALSRCALVSRRYLRTGHARVELRRP
jgi:alpha-galactosidase